MSGSPRSVSTSASMTARSQPYPYRSGLAASRSSAGPEPEHADDRGDPGGRTGEYRAHWYSGPAPAGLERHHHPGPAGGAGARGPLPRSPTPCPRRVGGRSARARPLSRHAATAARPDDEQDGYDAAQRQHASIDVETRIGLGPPGEPDRHERRGRRRDDRTGGRADHAPGSHGERPDAPSLPPRHAEHGTACDRRSRARRPGGRSPPPARPMPPPPRPRRRERDRSPGRGRSRRGPARRSRSTRRSRSGPRSGARPA